MHEQIPAALRLSEVSLWAEVQTEADRRRRQVAQMMKVGGSLSERERPNLRLIAHLLVRRSCSVVVSLGWRRAVSLRSAWRTAKEAEPPANTGPSSTPWNLTGRGVKREAIELLACGRVKEEGPLSAPSFRLSPKREKETTDHSEVPGRSWTVRFP